MFNFEKYMMSKPESPTITMNESDSSANDDKLFGVKASSRLKQELKTELEKNKNQANVNSSSSVNANTKAPDFVSASDLGEDFEIVFDNNNSKLDSQNSNGGAITEHYESPIIKRNKK